MRPLTEFKFPETIYMVGSGPKGHKAARNLSDDKFTVCVNGAYLLVPQPSVWMVKDHLYQIKKLVWWKKAQGYDFTNTLKIFCNRMQTECDYVFQKSQDKYPNTNDSIVGLTTSCGHNSFTCWQHGVKNFIFCGVDFQGSASYADKRKLNRSGFWPGGIKRMNRLIRHLEGHGCTFRTITPTSLDIEAWKP